MKFIKKKIKFKIINIKKIIFNKNVKKIDISCKNNQLGIYKNHSPLIAMIKKIKIIVYFKKKKTKNIKIFKGILEIINNKITIISI